MTDLIQSRKTYQDHLGEALTIIIENASRENCIEMYDGTKRSHFTLKTAKEWLVPELLDYKMTQKQIRDLWYDIRKFSWETDTPIITTTQGHYIGRHIDLSQWVGKYTKKIITQLKNLIMHFETISYLEDGDEIEKLATEIANLSEGIDYLMRDIKNMLLSNGIPLQQPLFGNDEFFKLPDKLDDTE